MKHYVGWYVFVLLLIWSVVGQAQSTSVLPRQGEASASGWEKEYWSKQRYYSTVPSAEAAYEALVIDADSLTHSRWFKKMPARPYADYSLTFRIKTEGVTGERPEAGAGIRLGTVRCTPDVILTGTNDWQTYTIDFSTDNDDSFLIECVLGKRGLAKGKVWFDSLRLTLRNARTLVPEVTLAWAQPGTPMSPYLYGQFIEHMGKCIYGGIWAEMLTDRKFYHTPGTRKSPWKITGGDSTTVRMDATDAYSEQHKVVVLPASKKGTIALMQAGLAFTAGKKYTGRLVVKADAGVKKMMVSAGWAGGQVDRTFKPSGKKYDVIPLEFETAGATPDGTLTITALGKGTVRIAAASIMPADNVQGFRPDVLALMKELNAPIYRWPGGNFVSGYNWKDGLGDPDKRPTRYEKAWNGLEYNDVGIHEFMTLCELLETDANIAVNTGLGTADMAAEEVMYFNGDASTPMGKWRAENGHPEPYGVKLWAVGNEMFGDWQLGHVPVEEYVKKHNEVAKAMWKVDPSIDLIAVGFPGHWNDTMYAHCSDHMTYISEHFYRQDWHAGGLMTHVKQIPDAIRSIAEEHRRCRQEIPALKGKDIKIALDEWNYWYGPHVYGLLGTRYFLRDALGIAAGVNELSRQSDIYYMANYAQTVNVIGAIKTTPTESFFAGTGLVLKMYRAHFGTLPIPLTGQPAPLDVAATLTADQQYLTISVVNPTTQQQTLTLHNIIDKIMPTGTAYQLTGADDRVYNEVHQDRITIQEKSVEVKDETLSVPPISAMIYKFSIRQ